MREEGINKDNFKEFFTNSNIYKELKGIENLTWENFIVSLGNYIPQIETELRNLSIDYSQMSDIEKIDEILAITLSSLKNWKKEELEEFYGPDDKNPMRWFGKKEKFYQDYKKSIEKMGDDHEKFFRSEILKLNSSAKKMIRKLASVYVLAEDNPNKITSNYLFKEGLMWEPITYDAWQKNIELKRWQK
jgi:DNA-directed RNA polymerase subunit F